MTNWIAREEDGAHWYDRRTGKPVYEVPLKTDPTRTKSPTLREARVLDLVPGATRITREKSRPGLQAWIIDQHIGAALTLPSIEGETMDERAKRVIRDAKAQVEKASSFGARMHEAIELHLSGSSDFLSGLLTSDIVFFAGVQSWLDANPIEVENLEFTFANRVLGYGGRLDAVGRIDLSGLGLAKDGPAFRRCIFDWKTQATVKDKPFRHYVEQGMQLIGYKRGQYADPDEFEQDDSLLFNLMISSTEPGRIEPWIWWEEARLWNGFNACRTLYYELGQGYSLVNPEGLLFDE